MLNQADGQTSLLQVASKSGIPFEALHAVARELAENELLEDDQASDESSRDPEVTS